MKFINVSGKAFNTIHANDFTYFEEVNHLVQEEPNDASDPQHSLRPWFTVPG